MRITRAFLEAQVRNLQRLVPDKLMLNYENNLYQLASISAQGETRLTLSAKPKQASMLIQAFIDGVRHAQTDKSIRHTNWPLFLEQKTTLVDVIVDCRAQGKPASADYLEGLLCLLDAIQDEAMPPIHHG